MRTLSVIITLVVAFTFAPFYGLSQSVHKVSYKKRKMVPRAKFVDLKGKTVKLSDFKGKVVYVDVWASWCNPCFKAFPSLQILEQEYNGKEIVFLSLNADEKKKKWKKTVRKKKVPGTHVWVGKDRSFLDKMTIITYPRYMLIDKEGRIYSKNADTPYNVRKELNRLLNE